MNEGRRERGWGGGGTKLRTGGRAGARAGGQEGGRRADGEGYWLNEQLRMCVSHSYSITKPIK